MSRPGTQRVGEILVIGAQGADLSSFLRVFCTSVAVTDEQILIGQVDIAHALSLYCYGIEIQSQRKTVAWDLLAKKMLGYIVLCNWFEKTSFSDCKKIIGFTTSRFDAPFIVAANVGEQSLPYGENLRRPEIVLSACSRMIFYRNRNSVHIRKVMLSLVDLLLEHYTV